MLNSSSGSELRDMSAEESAEVTERVGDGGRFDTLESTSPGNDVMVTTSNDKQRFQE